MSSTVRGLLASLALLVVLATPLAAQAGAQGATDSIPAPASGVGSGGLEATDSAGPAAAGVQAPPEGYAQEVQQSEGVRGMPGPRSLSDTRADLGTTWLQRLISLLGVGVMLLICWAISYHRKDVPWRVIGYGIGLQFLFALFILKTPLGEGLFSFINDLIVSLLSFTVQGASFLFGDLVWGIVPVGQGAAGTNAPFTPSAGTVARTGAFFAFNVLPTIIFFSSLMSVLYHLGVMQKVVKGIAWVMMRTLRTSGAETLSASGNIFVGQTEAPLLIKPFIERMTRSEIMAVMVAGFATVAGGVMAAYVGMLLPYFPDIAGHLLAASVMSAPAALVCAKLILPEKEEPVTRGTLGADIEKLDANVIGAAARGAGEGLTLALNVGAMLLAFIALVALLNAILGWFTDLVGLTTMLQNSGALAAGQGLTLEVILGWLLAPLAWLMGAPWADSVAVGSLLGIKTVLNEFVAYLQLGFMLENGSLSPRAVVIATYALCGFANFSSIAIQIGGIGSIAPNRRQDLAQLGMRAMIGGTIASFLTAAIAGAVL